EPQKENPEGKGSEFDGGESRSSSPSKEGSREHYQSSRGPRGGHFRRNNHYAYYDKRQHQDNQQPWRAYDNRPQSYDNRPPPPYNVYDNRPPPYNKFHGDYGGPGPGYYYDHPKYYHRGAPHGFIDGSGRGRGRPFRPYPGRHGGYFMKGYRHDLGPPMQHEGSETQTEAEDDWQEREEEQSNCGSSQQDGSERPSQPVHTVLINNEEYTKIQTPRQEVMFKKSSLDRKRDSIDLSSVTGSMSESGSGLSSGEGCSGQGDQVSLAGSMEDGNMDVTHEDDHNLNAHQDSMYDDPSEMFAGEPGQPPLAGVVMQQAYPGGPMVSIPVHWTPFIDPSFIPGETALTPLDPAFTHVLDSSDLPIDPIHILPMQHDAQGCPVQVQVKVDENGHPYQIEPSAFTVSLSSLHNHSMDPSLHDISLLHDHHALQEQDKLYMDQLVQDTQELLTKENKDQVIQDTQELLTQDNKDQIPNEPDTHQPDTTPQCEPTDTQTLICDSVQENTDKTQQVQVNECVIDDKSSDTYKSERIENSESESIDKENSVPCVDLSKALEMDKSIPAVVSIATKAKEAVSRMDQEEEDDEDIIAKDGEDGSDSNDSQYASMSESGSTPHSPAGEPCETSEEAVCSAQRNNDQADSSHHHDSLRDKAEDVDPLQHNEEDKQQDNQPTTMKGYVMVPILTPYYDPSVLYGYQMVVDQSQQHMQVPQPPLQHQHRYGKRKKKKNQRRRHADVPSAGGYLDPQLYTGEPFVAAPGGYVVPYDPSICHVHGISYMPPHHLQPQMSHDEGFSSLQHSPYLPETATEPHIPHGHNLDDDSKNLVFGNLQERERRQIQEILHERSKVGKSDSIESSDSGVSESEETALSEASSGKLRERHPSQGSKSSDNTEEKYSASSIEDEMDAHLNNSENLQEDTINSECSSISTGELSEFKRQNSMPNTSPLISSCCESDEKDKLLRSKTTEVLQSKNYTDGSEIMPNVASYSLETMHSNELNDQENSNLRISKNENVTLECNSDDIDNSHVPLSLKLSANSTENINQNTDTVKSEQSHGYMKSLNDSSLESTRELSKCLSDKFESSDTLPDSEDNMFKNSNEYNAINGHESVTEIECFSSNAKDFVELDSTEISLKKEKVKTIITELSTVESEVLKTENEVKANISIQDTGGTIESIIDHEDLKDLKVTEAVKRWIRDVTPEKAFTLSEHVQELLLSQQEFSDDDEYIEDEIEEDTKSINVLDPKNVRSNPFGAASNDSLNEVIECCSKRVASVSNEIVDEYDGASTISNLSHGRLYSESSFSFPPSINQSFDEVDEEETEEGTEKAEIYNPNIYAKYYQLGVDMEDTTPVATPGRTRENSPQSQCGSECADTDSCKFNTTGDYSSTSPLPLATELLKSEMISNMSHIADINEDVAHDALCLSNPDLYLKHFGASLREIGDSGVQSEESSDEIEFRSKSGVSSGIGSSLASTPALSPLHYTPNTTMPHNTHNKKSNHPLSHPLRNLTAGDGPVPCKTVCCSVM
ncbi:unnamed protein product, partial [Meganyctiphanes norvegica]